MSAEDFSEIRCACGWKFRLPGHSNTTADVLGQMASKHLEKVHPIKFPLVVNMDTVPSMTGVDKKPPSSDNAGVKEALDLARQYGGIEGEQHKNWVIDQMVRALTGTSYGYDEFVKAARAGEDGPETYDWEVGVAP